MLEAEHLAEGDRQAAAALEPAQGAKADAEAAEAALLNATANAVQLQAKAMELEITKEPEPEPESKLEALSAAADDAVVDTIITARTDGAPDRGEEETTAAATAAAGPAGASSDQWVKSVDCAGAWSACSVACEPADERRWTETVTP
eukprot:COSAG02_NODE_37736_length_438_cov_0.764012_1_plen_146_part_11